MRFDPPTQSKTLLAGVPFEQAMDTTPSAKARFDAFDKTAKGKKDPNKCKALLAFPNGTVFWSSKMAVDADGPPAGPGRKSGSELDPGDSDGQDETSFTFPITGKSLPAATVGYIAVPHLPNDKETPFHPSIKVGDVAIVIFKDEIAAGIVGDIGPAAKIGEASIHLHEELMPRVPDPCEKRDAQGFCTLIHDASVEEDVLYFVFPNSSFGNELTIENIETKVKERAFARYNDLKGV